MDFSRNTFLASLTKADLQVLTPDLRLVHLAQMDVLFDVGQIVASVYFPIDAAVSLVVPLKTGELIEAAMIGRDGVVGALSALDDKISLSRAVVQLAGDSFICPASVFRSSVMQSETLLSRILSHEKIVYAYAQQSTACMATHKVEKRFCRWLLRARDLAKSDTLPFTQEYLAEMLGVRRTSVTEVASKLQADGLIRYSRGKIEIVDVERMRETSCECYDTLHSHYDALLGV